MDLKVFLKPLQFEEEILGVNSIIYPHPIQFPNTRNIFNGFWACTPMGRAGPTLGLGCPTRNLILGGPMKCCPAQP